jgi:hypothetical protein
VDLNKNYADLTDDALATYATTVREAFDAITVLEAPSEAQVSEAEGYADHLDAIGTEQGKRVEAAAKLAARTSALRNRFSDSEPEAGETAGDTEEEDAVEEEDSEEEDAHLGTRTVHQPPGTEQSRSTVVALSRKVSRPAYR